MNSIRRDFADRELSETSVKKDPFQQYAVWFEEAVNCQILDPYAVCLSTVDESFQPSSRIIYIRDIQLDGFVFYTNYLSQKGKELAVHPNAAMNIHWGELERQIRIEGVVEKVSEKMSDKYFSGRPKESQIGAWASEQSDQIVDRKVLEERVEKYTQLFGEKKVDRPSHWGGYVLRPNKIEFWQGRPNRLHDRIVFLKEGGSWKIVRLSP